MSYQVLARKWRPQFFKDMVGQEHVLRALINALDNQRLHHAYLFTGTRGVGKTTIARILAKCLNCEQGISSQPCGTCSSCVEITDGRFVDLIEVDAASRTKVEDTREILDNVQYAPTRGRFKVYLIDEVHMLSNHSFNALLKTLEEPPPHVKFLLATTDPQKLPVTILSRCLQFSLKNMTPERIVHYLKSVLAEEQVTYQEPGLWLLGKAAEGSMRDALSLTDQAIAYGQGKIEELDVAAMLGTVDRGRVFQLAVALAERNASDVMAQIAQMAEHAVDFNNLLADLLSLLHRIAIAQAVPDAVDNSQGDKEQVVALSRAMSGSDLQLFYQIALTGKRDLPLAPDPRSGMEMTLLRMLNFAPTNIAIPSPAASTEQAGGMDGGKKPDLAHLKRQVAQAPSASSVQNSAPSAAPAHATSVDTPVVSREVGSHELESHDVPSHGKAIPSDTPETNRGQQASQASNQSPSVAVSREPAIVDSPPWEPEPQLKPHSGVPIEQHPPHSEIQPERIAPSAPAGNEQAPPPPHRFVEQYAHQEAEVQVASPSSNVVGINSHAEASKANNTHAEYADLPMSPESWALIFNAIPLEGMLRNLVANTCLASVNGDELLFHSDAGHIRLFGEAHQQRFQSTLNTSLSKQYRLKVVEGPITFETPAQRSQRLNAERLQQAILAIENDPNVQALKQAFDAQVIIDSVQPID